MAGLRKPAAPKQTDGRFKSKKPLLPVWFASSLHQEAFCRHLMLAETYMHGAAVGSAVQVLHDDIDVDGVDVSMAHDGTIVPLQLKSRRHGSSTRTWKVRRRLTIPRHGTPLHRAVFGGHEDVVTEGRGGAFVLQALVRLKAEPGAKVFYRVSRLELTYLRDRARFERVQRLCETAPKHLKLSEVDLTPPLSIADTLWLLLEIPRFEVGVLDDAVHPVAALVGQSGNPEVARKALADFERVARDRWEAWLKANKDVIAL